ncbi:MAG TPA: outer membrane beta-barrel protein, partial [Flavitalea sp.]|nr:outer membrane beta-barrel protein [Flavitalea sp.]
QPTIQQIQPILDNSNTLNIQIGNPTLKQEFRHNLNFQFNDFKVLSGRGIWFSGGFNAVDNAISTSSFITKGVRATQFVNVSGNYNANMWLGYWLQFKKIAGFRMGINSGLNFSKYNNYIDSARNTNNNKSVNFNMNIGYFKENKFDVYLNPGWSYVNSKSSINTSVITKYWTSESEAGATVQLSKKLEVNTSGNFYFRQKTDFFTQNRNSIKWNAYIAQKFWKNNNGEIRFSVFDILDQNIGFSRNAQSNFIEENTYNTIRRYWLVSFTWNFSSNAIGNTPNQQ